MKHKKKIVILVICELFFLLSNIYSKINSNLCELDSYKYSDNLNTLDTFQNEESENINAFCLNGNDIEIEDDDDEGSTVLSLKKKF